VKDGLSVGDGDLNLHTGLDGDGGDLLDDLGWRVEIDDALVDPHLESVPGLGTLTTRSLTGGDAENLGGHTDGSLDLQLLLLGSPDEVAADLLQALDVAGGQRDADSVDWAFLAGRLRGVFVHRLERKIEVKLSIIIMMGKMVIRGLNRMMISL